MTKRELNTNIKDSSKINIFITHADLDGNPSGGKEYNSVSSKVFKESKFDYVALGHIHKASYSDYAGQKVIYPGSTVSLGFDELGKRGYIEGSIDETTKKLCIKFINTTAKIFQEQKIDITEMISQEEVIENINSMQFDSDKYYKIILIGKRSFSIDENEILSLITKSNIIRIKNKTNIKYDIQEIAGRESLKGLFAKDILEQINSVENSEEEKEKLLNAFEIGMDILK